MDFFLSVAGREQLTRHASCWIDECYFYSRSRSFYTSNAIVAAFAKLPVWADLDCLDNFTGGVCVKYAYFYLQDVSR
jgi:hypothetical protein